MKLFQLRYFLLVAEFKSMCKAAEVLHVSEPSVSKAIKELQTELCTPLFWQNGRKLELSEAGEILLAKAPLLLNQIDTVSERLRPSEQKKLIKINALTAVSTVAKVVGIYHRLNENLAFQIISDLSLPNYDVCIQTTPNPLQSNTLLFGEEIYLAVPRMSKLGLRKEINISEIGSEPFIIMSKKRSLRRILDIASVTEGFSPNIYFESDAKSTIMDLVHEGLGVALWPSFSWGNVDSDQVCLVRIKSPLFRRFTYASWDEDGPHVKECLDYIAVLKEYICKNFPSAYELSPKR